MAITEYYVRDDAAGGGDGTTDTNSGANGAFTWAEFVTRVSAAGSAAPGDRYNIKKAQGSGYTSLAGVTAVIDGTPASPIIVRGFNSTPGDLASVGRTGGTGALDTTDFPHTQFASGARFNADGADYWIFETIRFSVASTGISGGTLTVGANSLVYRCASENISTNAAAGAFATSRSQVAFIDCDAALTGASGGGAAFNLNGGSYRIVGCRVTQSQARGINMTSTAGHVLILNNVIANCGLDGIDYTGTTIGTALTVIGNTVANCGGEGISIGNAAFTSLQLFMNNHVTGCARGFHSNYDATAQIAGVFVANRTRDNTTAAIDGFDDWASATSWGHVTTDTGGDSTDFTNAGSNDFTLISAAPAKGAGLPPYLDIGALQRQEPASSGGGALVIGG